ncbi:MAG TPA: GNAT family N-acetyltransferase [Pyrinomonadaceae bacterium]|nr:GNAT family N-acetyltransferase [Pyrinomonadaceae bacterium]
MIRKAVESNIEALCAIDTATRDDASRHDFISRQVREGSCYVLIDEKDGQIAAYGVLNYGFYNCGMIDMLMVEPDMRRRGFGSELMRRMESECRTNKLFTSTNESNAPMRSFLAKLGYSPSGIIHNLDPGDPELIFFKRLR